MLDSTSHRRPHTLAVTDRDTVPVIFHRGGGAHQWRLSGMPRHYTSDQHIHINEMFNVFRVGQGYITNVDNILETSNVAGKSTPDQGGALSVLLSFNKDFCNTLWLF